MPQMADEYTPEPPRGSPAAPIQAVPSGTGSLSPSEMPQVLQRLDEQRRVEAEAAERARRVAAQAEAAARARAQEQAQATARAQAAERARRTAQARAAEEARARAAAQAAQVEAAARARAQEQAAAQARAQESARARAAEQARAAELARTAAEVRAAEQRRAAERARAEEQALAEERARSSARTQEADRSRALGAEERWAAAEALVVEQTRASNESTAAQTAEAAPPPRDTPEYWAYLKKMLNGTPQGIAPGYGSISDAAAPARRSGEPELTLAQKLADGFTPGSGRRADGGGREPRQPRSPSIGDLSEEEKRLLRNMEREPASGLGARMFVGETLEAPPAPPTGPGARMFALTPEEEAMWAAISPDEYISEEAIAAWRQDARIPRTERQNSVLEALLPDADRRAAEIALAEAAGRWDEAAALGAGAPLEGSESFELPPVGDFARWGARQVRGALEQQNRTRERFFDEGRDVLDATIDGGQTALRAVGSELGEFGDLSPTELRDRLTQMTRGFWSGRDHALTLAEAILEMDPSELADNQFRDAVEGLFGNDLYEASDNPIIGALPEDGAVRDFAEASFNHLSDPINLLNLIALGVGVVNPLAGVAMGGGAHVADDLLSEDSDYAEPIEEHLIPRILDAINPPVLPNLPIR